MFDSNAGWRLGTRIGKQSWIRPQDDDYRIVAGGIDWEDVECAFTRNWRKLVIPTLFGVRFRVMVALATGILAATLAMADSQYSVEPWRRVLEAHQNLGGLDYAALKDDREDLDAYLTLLAGARPEGWSVEEQIAFWCNSYNAVVAFHVLDRYPDVESVKKVSGFFDELEFPVAGREMTLDELETEARSLGDPRVHFAVVCASTSCPDLQPSPFEGADARAPTRVSNP